MATHALHDLVSAWRYATDRWLGLHDPAAVRLLGIASHHLQQKADEAAATVKVAAAVPPDADGSADSGDAAGQQHAAEMQPAGSPADDAEPQQAADAPVEQEPPWTSDRVDPGETKGCSSHVTEALLIPALSATCCVPKLA